MIRDNDDRMVELLEQIVANTGNLDDVAGDTEVNISGQTADGRVGLVPKNGYVVLETDGLDSVDPGGAVTLEPGDSADLVKYDVGQPAAIYAVGATDEQGVSYELNVDSQTVGGRTNSPLGVLNDPFSFVTTIGGAIPVESRATYRAHYDSDASGTVELAGRMHLEVM